MQQIVRSVARLLDQRDVALEVGEAQQRHARLARAEELARTADQEVLARDLEAVGVLEDDLEPQLGDSPTGSSNSSTQVLSAAPRPTRPRSWCNCDRPKRSACSITISDAFGTSTPTSITVVATSTSISPRDERGHRRRLFVGLHPAVQQSDRERRQRRA